jgi:hypothetical protein
MEIKNKNRFAVIGVIASIPAFIIVAIGMVNAVGLKDLAETFNSYLTPQSFILHPALVLGGLMLSMGLNITPVVRIRFEPQNGILITTITTQVKLLNMAALAFSTLLLCALLLYAFGENFRIVSR